MPKNSLYYLFHDLLISEDTILYGDGYLTFAFIRL